MLSLRSFLFEFESNLQYHTVLNPVLWKNEKLRQPIRRKLLAFGKEYARYNNVPGSLIKDIIMVGGSAGYNYTPKSDIDVHVVIDRNALGSRKLVDELLQDKKKLWGLEHNIQVAGFPLEGYIQDHAEKAPKSQGIYSLVSEKWIQKPALPPKLDPNDLGFNAKVQAWIDRINHLIDTNAPLKQFKDLKKRLVNKRSSALAAGGEFAEGNREYKSLRNSGILDVMNKFIVKKFDKKYSLNFEKEEKQK